VCLPHDYLNLWLTGEFATEPGDASGTAWFDPVDRRYEATVLRALDPDRDWEAVLPPVRPSLSLVGRVRPDVAERTGLPAGAPVSAGGGDNMCAAIGAGVTEAGVAMVSLGTSGTVSTHSDEPRVDPAGEAAAFCDSTGGWLPLACTFNCTAAIDWLRGVLDLRLDEAEQLAAQAPPGAAGLTFLPYLTGERTPQRAPGEGRLVGLGTSHGRPEIIRAVFEGVTFSLLYAWRAVARTGVKAHEIVLVGGGSASAAWGRLVADTIGLPVGTLARPEAAATGAALQARWTVDGHRPDRPASGQRWEPDPHPALLAAIERWDRLREASAPAAAPAPGAAELPVLGGAGSS
jgi:xylulokinase